MNRASKIITKLITLVGCTFVAVMVFGLSAFAAGKATVTEKSAWIRSQASTSSTRLASAMQNDVLEVLGSENGADGYTWYKVRIDANTTGYIRGDNVTTEGVTSNNTTTTNNNTTTTTPTKKPVSTEPTYPTECEPISGTVSYDVRVRKGASTDHEIVTQAKKKSVVTVIGYAQGTDMVWYQVNYTTGTSEITGYIRSDAIELAGELKDKVAPEPEPEPEPLPAPEPEPEPEPVYKDYEAVFSESDNTWYLNNYIEGTKTSISNLYEVAKNAETIKKEYETKLKKKNWAIGILVFLLVAALAGAAYLFLMFKGWYRGDEDDEPVKSYRPSKRDRNPAPSRREQTPVRTQSVSRPVSNVRAQTVGAPVRESQPTVHTEAAPKRLPDGRVQMPDGTIKKAIVAVKLPDGSIKFPDGTIRRPDGTTIRPEVAQSTVINAEKPEAPVHEPRVGMSSQAVRGVSRNSSFDDEDDDMEYGFLNLDKDLDD